MERKERQFTPEIDVSIVLPVYNEEPNLLPLDAELRSVLRAMGKSAEIIYVDDFSRDGSRAVLERLVQCSIKDPIRTRVVRFRRNYGQTAAMTAGFQLAEGRVICPLGRRRPEQPGRYPAALGRAREGLRRRERLAKNRKDKALSRKLPSRVANWLIGLVSGVRLHDHGCTLKAYRASLLKELHLYGEMHRFIPLYLNHIGARVGELAVDHRPRTAGVSKYGPRRIISVALDVVLIRFITRYYNRPMHFFGQMGLIFFLMVLLNFVLHGGLQVRLVAAYRDRLQGQLRRDAASRLGGDVSRGNDRLVVLRCLGRDPDQGPLRISRGPSLCDRVGAGFIRGGCPGAGARRQSVRTICHSSGRFARVGRHGRIDRLIGGRCCESSPGALR